MNGQRSKSTVIMYAVAAAVALAVVGVSSYEQSFAIEPDDMTAVLDSTVALSCRIDHLAGLVQWTKDDFALGFNRNLSYHGFPRYAMVGNQEMGDYNLRVKPVKLDDDGLYQCQVGSGKRNERAIRSRKAMLTVLVPPDRPRILQGTHMTTTEGIPLELECESNGGKPPAEITWTDGSGNVIANGIKTYIEVMANESRLFNTKSVLKIIPKMEHHNTSIRCQAYNPALDKKLYTKIHLDVKFAPKISLIIASPTKKLIEGSDVQFLCSTKANPKDVTYRWFINDQFVSNEVTSELWIMNITRRLHNSYVRCEAQNTIDKTEDSKMLSILYKPQFKNRPKNMQADPGSFVSILCDVDSNPPASIEWTLEKTKKIVSTTSNLTIQVSSATAGRYHCKASTSGFGELNTEVTVLMKGPPVINSPRVQHGTPTDTVRLECTASSIPVPDRIVWAYQGTIIGTHSDRNYYAVLEDPTDDGMKSTLIIRNARDEQFGKYNCTASNYYGSDSIEIVLVPKKDIMLILAIIGAAGGITVLIIIFLVVVFCRRSTTRDRKKVKKPEFVGGESDAENKQNAAAKDSDVSSNVSDIKIETGTGSSLSNYRYKVDYGSTGGGGGGADSMTMTTTIDEQRRSTTPKSGGGGSQTTLSRGGGSGGGGGIPLAGPVPVDPRYATAGSYLGHQQNVMHHPLSNRTINDYADPLNYVRYSTTTADRITSNSNSINGSGYIAADRLYDLNPMPSSVISSPSTATNCNGTINNDPATTLQYSAAYGNPYLKTNTSQWMTQPAHRLSYDGRPEPPPYSAVKGAGGRKTVQVTNKPTTVDLNYHIGLTKRQTLATHV